MEHNPLISLDHLFLSEDVKLLLSNLQIPFAGLKTLGTSEVNPEISTDKLNEEN